MLNVFTLQLKPWGSYCVIAALCSWPGSGRNCGAKILLDSFGSDSDYEALGAAAARIALAPASRMAMASEGPNDLVDGHEPCAEGSAAELHLLDADMTGRAEGQYEDDGTSKGTAKTL